MIIGMVLFSNGVVNLYSSMLLFLGGYIAIKNSFDYRVVKKNIKKCQDNSCSLFDKKTNNQELKPREIKKIKRNIRVRKREK